jgi:hypothetical protein
MTTFESFPSRNRDVQDGIERMVFGKLTHLGTGTVATLRGNGTQDEEVVVVNIGQGMNFAENTNTEVLVFASGSDTNMKFAMLTIPRDKQRPWKEGTGGVQHPTDPDRALEFNDKRTHLTDGNYAVGENGTLEVRGGTVYIRGDLIVEGKVTANEKVRTPKSENGTDDIPGFEA